MDKQMNMLKLRMGTSKYFVRERLLL
jgi:serine/threonine protein kinase